MSDERKQKPHVGGPTPAEQLWFTASDRFYKVLEKQGPAAAQQAAEAVLAVLPAPPPKPGARE